MLLPRKVPSSRQFRSTIVHSSSRASYASPCACSRQTLEGLSPVAHMHAYFCLKWESIQFRLPTSSRGPFPSRDTASLSRAACSLMAPQHAPPRNSSHTRHVLNCLHHTLNQVLRGASLLSHLHALGYAASGVPVGLRQQHAHLLDEHLQGSSSKVFTQYGTTACRFRTDRPCSTCTRKNCGMCHWKLSAASLSAQAGCQGRIISRACTCPVMQ